MLGRRNFFGLHSTVYPTSSSLLRAYLYADETGNLDYELHLRAEATKNGIHLPKGFHACEDSNQTRSEMFAEIQRQSPQIGTTVLYKANAYQYVRDAGPLRLYTMAFFLHVKEIALHVSEPNDELFVITAEFGTKQNALRMVSSIIMGFTGL